MYFEPIECTVEEAERNAQEQFEQMCEFDKELVRLRKKRDMYDDTDIQDCEIIAEIDNEIYVTESCANKCDTYYDYWQTQARWARQRELEELSLQETK